MKSIKIKIAHILPFFLILLLFVPMIVINFDFADSIVSLCTNAVLCVGLLVWLINKCQLSKWAMVVGVFCIIPIVTTIINNGNIAATAISYIKIFASCILIEILILKYKQDTLTIIKNALFVLVALNLLSMILMPTGVIQLERDVNEWYQYSVPWWLFGNKNSMFLWLFPANVLAQISIFQNRLNHKQNVYNYVMLCLTIITAFLSSSGTTIFVICLVSLCVFLNKIFTKFNKVFTMGNYIIFLVILTVLLVTATHFGLFDFLALLFHKDATFTGRVTAWQQSVVLLKSNPIFGYGALSENDFRKILGAYAFVNSHNSILQIAIEGGAFLVAQFFVLLKILSGRLKEMKLNNNIFYSLSAWCMLSLFIHMSFEATIESKMFWMVLTIIYYIPLLIKNDIKDEKSI